MLRSRFQHRTQKPREHDLRVCSEYRDMTLFNLPPLDDEWFAVAEFLRFTAATLPPPLLAYGDVAASC